MGHLVRTLSFCPSWSQASGRILTWRTVWARKDRLSIHCSHITASHSQMRMTFGWSVVSPVGRAIKRRWAMQVTWLLQGKSPQIPCPLITHVQCFIGGVLPSVAFHAAPTRTYIMLLHLHPCPSGFVTGYPWAVLVVSLCSFSLCLLPHHQVFSLLSLKPFSNLCSHHVYYLPPLLSIYPNVF